MDLWIRSQENKDIVPSLSKKTDIWICETDNQVLIEDHQGPIAIYDSRERAQEILDDIQQHMTYGKEIYEHDSIYSDHYHSCKCYKSDSLMIYEMPKE